MIMDIWLARSMTCAGVLSGFVSLMLFAAFLYVGSFSFFDFALSEPARLGLDTGLSLMFFIQHSVMLRKSFRDFAQKVVPATCYGALYAAVSGLTLLVLLVFWQKSGIVLISADGMFRWVSRIVFFGSMAGFAWATRALGAFDPFGAKIIICHMNNRRPKNLSLSIRGPYKRVRHPLYFFSLLMIWFCPDISADRLLFNGLWTLWIIIGTILEERDLVREFGAAYQQYQRQTPMLIPWKFFLALNSYSSGESKKEK